MSEKHKMAGSAYLIYTCWTTTLDSGGSIAGSLQHDYVVQTEAEAEAALAELQMRATEFQKAHPLLYKNTVNSYVYIKNRPEWWVR
jgi:hypothetical protein